MDLVLWIIIEWLGSLCLFYNTASNFSLLFFLLHFTLPSPRVIRNLLKWSESWLPEAGAWGRFPVWVDNHRPAWLRRLEQEPGPYSLEMRRWKRKWDHKKRRKCSWKCQNILSSDIPYCFPQWSVNVNLDSLVAVKCNAIQTVKASCLAQGHSPHWGPQSQTGQGPVSGWG